MGSMYAKIRSEATLGSAKTTRIADFDETDPYYFVVKEEEKILAEGDLMAIKLKLPENYMYKKIKSFNRDRTIMVATVMF